MSGAGGHLGDKLQDVADHRLSGAELAAASDHLARCERCRRELDTLLRVRQAIAPKAGHDAVPAELRASVSQLLARERTAAKPSMARRVLAGARSRWMVGAGMAVLVAIALFLWVSTIGS
jgi:anti-sigma factor RsiW